jgi:hypothetical protein
MKLSELIGMTFQIVDVDRDAVILRDISLGYGGIIGPGKMYQVSATGDDQGTELYWQVLEPKEIKK